METDRSFVQRKGGAGECRSVCHPSWADILAKHVVHIRWFPCKPTCFGHTSLLCEVHAAPSFAEIGYFRRVDKARQRNEIQSIHKELTVSM